MTYENDLHLEVNYGSDLIDSDVLLVVQELLIRHAPKVAASLEVHGFERDPARILVDLSDPQALREAVRIKGTERGPVAEDLSRLHGQPRYPRRFGSVLIRGRGPGTGGLHLSVRFDAYVPAAPMGTSWMWSNSISLSVSTERVHGVGRQEWVARAVSEITDRTDVLWGAAYLNAEFQQSNLYQGPDGIHALGRDMRTSLPGIFWLNIFGEPYVELLGMARLLSIPAYGVHQSNQQVIMQAYEDAATWADQRATKRALIAAIGADFFFDRDDPDGPHRSPDFGLGDLAPSSAFQVMTDGETYTELP